MTYLDTWRGQIPNSLTTFKALLPQLHEIDPQYGIFAAALLWPIRAMSDDQRAALDLIIDNATSADLIRDILQRNTDPLATARELAQQAAGNPVLRAALDRVLTQFQDLLAAQDLIASISMGGNVSGGMVNIGGKDYFYGPVVVNQNSYQTNTTTARSWTFPVVIGLLLLVIIAGFIVLSSLPQPQRDHLLHQIGMLPASATSTNTPTATFTPTNTPTPSNTPTITPTPLAGPTAVITGANREVRVVIAAFNDVDNTGLRPDKAWELRLNNAKDQLKLKGQANVTVTRIDEVIQSDDAAKKISSIYKATIVIWGNVYSAGIDSFYTITPQWSRIAVNPANTQLVDSPDKVRVFETSADEPKYVVSFVLAQLAYFGDARQDALPTLNTAIAEGEALTPNSHKAEMGVPALYFYRGDIYYDQNNWPQALADFNQALTLDPNYADAYSNRASVYYFQQQYAQALTDYNQALKLNPTNAVYYSNRGNVYADQNQNSLALADFDQALKLDPTNAAAYIDRGLTYTDQQQYALALDDFNRAIKIDPTIAKAYNNRANVYADQHQNDLALADYTQALKLDPTYVNAYYNRGLLYNDQKQYDQALADYTQAISLAPKFTEAYDDRGLVYAAQQQYPQALADYNQALKLDPKNVRAYTNRGNLYYRQQQNDLALADFNQALRLDPTYVIAYNNRGLVYMAQKQYPQALADYNQALKLDPNNARTYARREGVYVAMKQYALALADVNKYLEFVPHDTNAKAQVALLESMLSATPTPTATPSTF